MATNFRGEIGLPTFILCIGILKWISISQHRWAH